VLFSNNLVTKKSTEGYLFTLFKKKLVNWQSIKQKLMTKLSIKVEFLALSHAAIKLI
jgi:NADPH-dependent 7-cyano-7-deazaguanine reductase QueF-like protein